MKQMLVMRNDLGMRKGKMCAQAAHASVGAVIANLDEPRVKEWLAGPFTKVCVRVDSEEELMELVHRAKMANLIHCPIVDSGKTEFGGVPTLTCCAIGPDTDDALDPITGELKLL